MVYNYEIVLMKRKENITLSFTCCCRAFPTRESGTLYCDPIPSLPLFFPYLRNFPFRRVPPFFKCRFSFAPPLPPLRRRGWKSSWGVYKPSSSNTLNNLSRWICSALYITCVIYFILFFHFSIASHPARLGSSGDLILIYYHYYHVQGLTFRWSRHLPLCYLDEIKPPPLFLCKSIMIIKV